MEDVVSRTTSMVVLYDVHGEGYTNTVRRIGGRLLNKAESNLFQGRAQVATLGAPVNGFVKI